MKETRRLRVIYFVISVFLLMFVCMVCENNQNEETRICRTYEEMDYVVCYDSEWKSYDEMKLEGVNFIEGGLKNFILQSDFGIIEVEDGEIIYSNITKKDSSESFLFYSLDSPSNHLSKVYEKIFRRFAS